jgi:hypothetical protein
MCRYLWDYHAPTSVPYLLAGLDRGVYVSKGWMEILEWIYRDKTK